MPSLDWSLMTWGCWDANTVHAASVDRGDVEAGEPIQARPSLVSLFICPWLPQLDVLKFSTISLFSLGQPNWWYARSLPWEDLAPQVLLWAPRQSLVVMWCLVRLRFSSCLISSPRPFHSPFISPVDLGLSSEPRMINMTTILALLLLPPGPQRGHWPWDNQDLTLTLRAGSLYHVPLITKQARESHS